MCIALILQATSPLPGWLGIQVEEWLIEYSKKGIVAIAIATESAFENKKGQSEIKRK